MNKRELILICLAEVVLACLIFCIVGMIFHGCDSENDSIDAVEKDSHRTIVVPGWSNARAMWKRSIPVPDTSSRSRC